MCVSIETLYKHHLEQIHTHATRLSKDLKTLKETDSHVLAAELLTRIDSNASLTGNYIIFVGIAAVIAGCGLASNSGVSVVASMLVSPIMGPVLGCTLGFVLRDWELMYKGFITEVASLLLCVVVGFVIGLLWWFLPCFDTDLLPTTEMSSRGEVLGLASSFLVAIVSGAGVALSVLNDNISSLVGVAISAALLPPAVNSGIYLVLAIFDSDHCVRYLQECCITMALTIENILLIFIAAAVTWHIEKIWIPLNSTVDDTIKIIAQGQNLLKKRKEDPLQRAHASLTTVFEISPVHSTSFFFDKSFNFNQSHGHGKYD